MKGRKRIKKASFTVEAAFIVPLSAAVLALLIVFIYFTHEKAWAVSVACEASFYAMQRQESEETRGEILEERLEVRKKENPLGVNMTDYKVEESKKNLKISMEECVFPESFGKRFSSSFYLELKLFDPVKVKRTLWLGNYVTKQQEGSES
jgi:hypothetical protein